MKKAKKKVRGLSKSKTNPERAWLGNPLFMAALITIMAVLAFILADDWVNLQKVSAKPVVVAPQISVKVTPTKAPLRK